MGDPFFESYEAFPIKQLSVATSVSEHKTVETNYQVARFNEEERLYSKRVTPSAFTIKTVINRGPSKK